MKTVMAIIMVVSLVGFAVPVSANYLVDGSTVVGSTQYSNNNVSWGYQRYAGDGDDFAHAWFDVITPYQVNNVQWVWWPTTDPNHWSASLIVWEYETPGGATWASSNTFDINDVQVVEGHSNDWSYSRSWFSSDVEVWSPISEFTSITTSSSEVAPDDTHFLVRYNIEGDFLAAPVPEPGTVGLLILGALGIVARRRRIR